VINGQARSRSFAQRELEKVQRKVTEGQLAERRRRELIVHLHRQENMSQVDIAALLTRAATAVGGQPVGDDAVWKIVKAARSHR
jgi:CRISPR/Cas system-associated endoribonuclease Cas2